MIGIDTDHTRHAPVWATPEFLSRWFPLYPSQAQHETAGERAGGRAADIVVR